jgi:uncharacterized protein DUF4136
MRRRLLAIASLMLLSTIVLAKDVNYDFDRAVNFSKFKSYAWVAGTNVKDDLNHKRIVNAVDTQLASKGLKKVGTDENPDVLVAYHASVNRDLEINAFSSGWGPFGIGGNRSGSARTSEIFVGTLVVDMMDPATRIVVWRGNASRDLDPNANPEKRDKNINKAIGKLFENYPPKTK